MTQPATEMKMRQFELPLGFRMDPVPREMVNAIRQWYRDYYHPNMDADAMPEYMDPPCPTGWDYEGIQCLGGKTYCICRRGIQTMLICCD
jgi:hypothetical protein